MSNDPIVIVSYARTPMGSFQGSLSDVKSTKLGSVAIEASIDKAGIQSADVDEVIMGVVLPAGLGQAPTRQASIGAGIPLDKGSTTINKMCGSGMKAIMIAHDQIKAGSANIMIAGGMESMTNSPYILPKARGGMRMGHAEVKDHMFLDGLEDAYNPGKLMGVFADATAEKYGFTREEQDAFAIGSVEKAKKAVNEGWFKNEITPVEIETRKGVVTVDTDESPLNAKVEKIPMLRPAFGKKGTVTAANASSISDGAAALLMMKQSEAEKRGLKPVAKIVAQSTNAHEPAWFTTAPVGAIEKIYKQTGWTEEDVDLYEINEAFAVVTMAAMKDLNIPESKVNIHGGACALGHPIGASGARIVTTLLSALEKIDGKKGIASLCIGGGEAVAIAVERF